MHAVSALCAIDMKAPKKKRFNLVAGLGACVCASREVKGRSNIHTRTYVDELEISKSEKGNFEWEVIGLTARHSTADERRGQYKIKMSKGELLLLRN